MRQISRSDNFAKRIARIALSGAMLFASGSYANSHFKDAYFRLEANVFDRSVLNNVLADLKSPAAGRDNDPWVYLTASLAVLVSGYQIGDWYSEKSFAPGTADRALELAATARSIAPDLSQSHAHYGRLLILKGRYKQAWEVLNKAHELDPGSFYPWYFRGITAEKMRDAKRAMSYFDEAERRIALDYQRGLVNTHRQKVARLAGNYDEQERLLKENIAREPQDPIYYGNYAHFLMKHKRYEEAIEYWEKAIAHGPYPHAIEQLAEARRLRDQQEGTKPVAK